MFSILLPMKRLPEHIVEKVFSNAECRRYANPAKLQRLANDKERSTPRTTPHATPRTTPLASPITSPPVSRKTSPVTSRKTLDHVSTNGAKASAGNGSNSSMLMHPQETDGLLPLVPHVSYSSTNDNDHLPSPGSGPDFTGLHTTVRPIENSTRSLHSSPLSAVQELLSTEANNSKRSKSTDDLRQLQQPAVSTTSRSALVGDASEKYYILVVDDSPLNRKMLTKLLKSKGHRCTPPRHSHLSRPPFFTSPPLLLHPV